MGNADWAWRLASIEEDGWELESGEARHRHSGDDFPIPPESERRQIEPGHLDRGDEFLFKSEHVIDITDLPREYLLEHFGSRLQFPENDPFRRLN